MKLFSCVSFITLQILGLLSSTGFDFNILWRDSENQEYSVVTVFSKKECHFPLLDGMPFPFDCINPLSPNINIVILLSVLRIFLMVSLAII